MTKAPTFFIACFLLSVVVLPFGQGLAQSTNPQPDSHCTGQSDILGGRKDILNPTTPETCDNTTVPADLNPNTAQLLSILKQTGGDLGDLSAAWKAIVSEPRDRAAAAQRYKVVEQDEQEKSRKREREEAERKTSAGRLSALNQKLESENKTITDFEKNITAFQSKIDQFNLKDKDGTQLRVFSDATKVVETFDPQKFKTAVDQLNKIIGRAAGQETQ